MMKRNLFVSYDLNTPGQNYEEVIAEIKKQGDSWAKVHYSLFYLKSDKTAQQIAEAVWRKMDANDRLIVVDATNNDAFWYNLPTDVSDLIQKVWKA
jgi:hypothetical protein